MVFLHTHRTTITMKILSNMSILSTYIFRLGPLVYVAAALMLKIVRSCSEDFGFSLSLYVILFAHKL